MIEVKASLSYMNSLVCQICSKIHWSLRARWLIAKHMHDILHKVIIAATNFIALEIIACIL
jgi:hypothetical protein